MSQDGLRTRKLCQSPMSVLCFSKIPNQAKTQKTDELLCFKARIKLRKRIIAFLAKIPYSHHY